MSGYCEAVCQHRSDDTPISAMTMRTQNLGNGPLAIPDGTYCNDPVYLPLRLYQRPSYPRATSLMSIALAQGMMP